MIPLWNFFGKLTLTTGTHVRTQAEEEETTSQLLHLPSEIILLIANMLPESSAACLALCNRRFKHTLGPGFWRSLQRDAADVRLAFMASFAKDLPQHFVCKECGCLHRMSTIGWPRVIRHHLPHCCTWRSLGYLLSTILLAVSNILHSRLPSNETALL